LWGSIDSGLVGRGTTRAEDAQGKPDRGVGLDRGVGFRGYRTGEGCSEAARGAEVRVDSCRAHLVQRTPDDLVGKGFVQFKNNCFAEM